MRQSLRFLVSLSAVATVLGAGLSLAIAQESTPQTNTPSPGPVLPESTPDTSAAQGSDAMNTPSFEPSTPYMQTTETPAFTISDPNEPMIDAKTTRTRRPNLPLLGTGSLLFVGSYVPTIIYQGAKDRDSDLYIPIAGPWMDLAEGHNSTTEKTLLSLSGVAQGLGALAIVSSFFVPERKTRNWSLIGMRRARENRKASVAFAPNMGYGRFGVGALGRF